MRSAIQFAVGLVLFALVARVFLVMGLIVPVTVAGSSMAPTLIGPHIAATCPRCGSNSQVDADQLPAGGWVACSSCTALMTINDLPVSAGDSLWIDRTAFALREPRRWEVVVFQCPDDATQLCVKRVLGLPGERIAIRDGYLFVNGLRVANPLDIDYQVRPGDGFGQRGYDSRQQCWRLGEGYFVVGDNHRVSLDSRNWPSGPDLPPKLVVGRPIARASIRVVVGTGILTPQAFHLLARSEWGSSGSRRLGARGLPILARVGSQKSLHFKGDCQHCQL